MAKGQSTASDSGALIKKNKHSGKAEEPSHSGHDPIRRKALKAGVIGIPVILTLKARTACADTLSAGSANSSTTTGGTGVPKPTP
jgi:hypothetical protein